jgi:acyl-CoA synthetase (AMP-forming)/AMP-acid ligase II
MPALTRLNWRDAERWHREGTWRDETVPHLLLRAAESAPAGAGVSDPRWGVTTWAQVAEWVGFLAGRLRGAGVQPGDIVPVLVPDGTLFIASMIAVQATGAVCAPLSHRIGSVALERVLSATGSRHVLATHEVDAVRSTDAQVVVAQPPAPGERQHTVDLSHVDADVVGDVMFTSGTTGQPKGVMNTSNTKLCGLRGFLSEFDFRPDDVWAQLAPMTHNAGWLYTVLPALATMGSIHVVPRGDANHMLTAISQSRATVSFLVPTHIEDLMAAWQRTQRSVDLSLRYVITGAAAADPGSLDRIRDDWGAAVISMYGLTETQGVLFTRPADGAAASHDSVGKASPEVDLGLRHPDDATLPSEPGEPGELVVRGPTVFVGYLGNEAATRSAFTADGWFRTGDLAVESEGVYRIVSRIKDVILRGGATITPGDVEAAVSTVLNGAEVAVIGLPDERLGECVCVCVVHTEPLSVDELCVDLSRWGYGVDLLPDALVLVDALPRTDLGKVQRPLLRTQVLDGRYGTVSRRAPRRSG